MHEPAQVTDLMPRNEQMRGSIRCIEETIRELVTAQGLPSPDCPLTHQFAPGVYVRTIVIPKDTLVVGKIHKHAHPNMVLQGHVLLATEEGYAELRAPQVLISKAGTKRVLYTLEDTIWTTVHLTPFTDLDQIEEDIIAKTYEEFDALTQPSCSMMGEPKEDV